MKVIKVLQGGITALLVVIIAILLVVFFIPQCLGYQPYNIETGSMTPRYPIGSMIYVRSIAFEELKEQDVVTYRTAQGSGWVVTHRITQIDREAKTVVTKGDANNTEDGTLYYSNIIGKATDFAIPLLGGVVTQYQEGNGKVFTIIGIVGLLGLSFLLDVIAKRLEPEQA